MAVFDAIETSLPNGFHDAFLRSLSVDYVARTAELELEVWVAESIADDRETREAYRRGRLQVSGLIFITVDVPNQEALPDTPIGLRIEAVRARETSFVKPEWPANSLPEGSFFRSFPFTDEWNSGVHLAAKDAEWTWLSNARTIY